MQHNMKITKITKEEKDLEAEEAEGAGVMKKKMKVIKIINQKGKDTKITTEMKEQDIKTKKIGMYHTLMKNKGGHTTNGIDKK